MCLQGPGPLSGTGRKRLDDGREMPVLPLLHITLALASTGIPTAYRRLSVGAPLNGISVPRKKRTRGSVIAGDLPSCPVTMMHCRADDFPGLSRSDALHRSDNVRNNVE